MERTVPNTVAAAAQKRDTGFVHLTVGMCMLYP